MRWLAVKILTLQPLQIGHFHHHPSASPANSSFPKTNTIVIIFKKNSRSLMGRHGGHFFRLQEMVIGQCHHQMMNYSPNLQHAQPTVTHHSPHRLKLDYVLIFPQTNQNKINKKSLSFMIVMINTTRGRGRGILRISAGSRGAT